MQPGVVLDELREPAEQQHGLTFGPDPSTHDHCTLGGMIGNNSCGVHSVMAQFYGPGPAHVRQRARARGAALRRRAGCALGARATSRRRRRSTARLRDLRDRYADLIRERYPNIPRRVSGYNLDDLLPENGFHVARALVGTEGTCVTVLEATRAPGRTARRRARCSCSATTTSTAPPTTSRDVLEHKPIGLEGIDDVLVEDMKVVGIHDEDLTLLPEGRGWLLVEFGGETKEEADDKRARAAWTRSSTATARRRA